MCVCKVDDSAASDLSMATSNLAQFVLLLWKNWLLHKRRIDEMIVNHIIFPALFPIILLLVCTKHESKVVPQPTRWDSFEVSTLPPNLTLPPIGPNKAGNLTWILAFSPNTSLAARRIATETAKALDMTPFPIGIRHSIIFLCRLLYYKKV